MTNLVARYDAARLGLLRTSRRDVLRFSVGAGLGAVLLPLLAACGSSKSSTPTATAGSGAAGATIVALRCPVDNIIHIALWHGLAVLVLGLVGRLALPPLLRW